MASKMTERGPETRSFIPATLSDTKLLSDSISSFDSSTVAVLVAVMAVMAVM